MTDSNHKNMAIELERRELEISQLKADRERAERELQNSKTEAEKEIKELKENLKFLIETTQERNRENLRKFYNPQGILNRADMAITDIEAIYNSVVSIPPHLISDNMSSAIIEKMERVKDEANEVIKKI